MLRAEVDSLRLALQTEEKRKKDRFDRDPRKQTFPLLADLEANNDSAEAKQRRDFMLTELLQWDKKNNINVSIFIFLC